MKLGSIRKDLEQYKDYRIYYNIKNYKDFEKSDKYISDLLKLSDNYELPYECYEVLYDFGCDGWYDDGYNVVCFYTTGPGCLHSNWAYAKLYNKKYLNELIPEEKESYNKYMRLRENNPTEVLGINENNKKELEKIKRNKQCN